MRRNRRWITCTLLGGVGIPLLGCTKFDQTHYVGVVNPRSTAVQFYRFRLKGRPGFLMKTKFVSGWYSADAIDRFVGEKAAIDFSPVAASSGSEGEGPSDGGNGKSEGGEEKKSTANGDSMDYRDGGVYMVTGPEGEGFPSGSKRFVIIMSSDPEPITKAIGDLASDEAIKQLIQNMAVRDEAKRQKAQQDQAAQKELAKAVLLPLCGQAEKRLLILAAEASLGEKICPEPSVEESEQPAEEDD